MDKFSKVKANLEKHGYKVSVFADAKSAADYLDWSIDGKSVGIGGSMTIQGMGMFDRLRSHNVVYSHLNGFPTEQNGELVYGAPTPPDHRAEGFKQAAFADIYLASVNGLSETGEIINMTAMATELPPPFSDMRRCISWLDATRSPPITIRRWNAPEMSPPPKTPAAKTPPPPASHREQRAALTAPLPTASAAE